MDEDPEITEGYEMSELPPDAQKMKKMTKEKIMCEWDTRWAVGIVKNKHSKNGKYNNYYFVQHEESDGEKCQVRSTRNFASELHHESNTQDGCIWIKKCR